MIANDETEKIHYFQFKYFIIMIMIILYIYDLYHYSVPLIKL